MHDTDRTSLEFEHSQDELGQELASEWSPEQDFPGEASESELATELLSISSEEELESFLGELIMEAGQDAGRVIRSPTGRALGGILKKAALHALPILGRFAGNLVAPGIGGMIGGKIGSAMGRVFGLELEGLSSQEQELETALAFLQFADAAAREAAQIDSDAAPPQQVATQAATAAAERHAPGLLHDGVPGRAPCHCGPHRHAGSGRWVRRGHRIVLLGI